MSQSFRDLQQDLPARSPHGPDNFTADPKRASAWVGTLPRANPTATADMLEQALLDLQRCQLASGVRLPVLEVLRPLLLEVIEGLYAQCQGVGIPLPAAKAKVFERLQKLEAALAMGYRLAVVEQCAPSGSVPFLRGGSVAQALVRAIYHTTRCLQHAYQIYRKPPAGVWLQLHRLFDFATTVRLQDKAIEDSHAGHPLNAVGLYGHAILQAISNPYRFSQREQRELARSGPELGRLLVIRDGRRHEDDLGVPRNADRGPGYLASEREEEGGQQLWIDLIPLRERVAGALDAAGEMATFRGADGKTFQMPADLLRSMRAGWARSHVRDSQRLSAQHRLDTALGLSALHFHIAGQIDFETFLRQAGESDEDRLEVSSRRAVWTHAAPDPGRMSLQHAEVADQSLGGYQLRWAAEEGVKARVGELIGLSVPAEGEERRWLLGVVRWLRYEDDGSLDAGVQLISRRVRPVALRMTDAADSERPALRGIEYRPVRGDDPGALYFSAALGVEAGARQIEVLRVPDINDLDEPVPLREVTTELRVAEHAGDYLLLHAQRVEALA